MDFQEGQEYDIDELPESEMTNSGSWELVDSQTLGGVVDGQYVTLEYRTVECVDVRPVDDSSDEHESERNE